LAGLEDGSDETAEVHLDGERRAAFAANLMTVIASDSPTNPVVNVGSDSQYGCSPVPGRGRARRRVTAERRTYRWVYDTFVDESVIKPPPTQAPRRAIRGP